MNADLRTAIQPIQQRIRELRTEIETLTAALDILLRKRSSSAATTEEPNRRAVRKSNQDRFDTMMQILTAEKHPRTATEVRDALRAKGYPMTTAETSIWNHLQRAVKLGYAIKRGTKYVVSPTIHKVMAKTVNGHLPSKGHKRAFLGDVYDTTIDIIRSSADPATKGTIRAALKQRKMSTSAIYGHLERAVKLGAVQRTGKGLKATYRVNAQ